MQNSVTIGDLTLTMLTPTIVHVQQPPLATHSYAVVGDKAKPTEIVIDQSAQQVSVSSDALKVVADDAGHVDAFLPDGTALVQDFRGGRVPLFRDMTAEQKALVEAEGHVLADAPGLAAVEVVKELHADEHFYGLGDKTGFLDKRGYVYDNWNTDEPNQIEEQTKIYKSIPFVIGLHGGHAYGLFFDNPYPSHFDLGKESPDYFYYSAAAGGVDYYLMVGASVADVVSNYTYLTGRTPLPQKWTLGYQQSRFSYFTEAQVQGIADKMRALHLPCDVIHLDIDYMDGYRVFTVDPKKFPDLKAMAKRLKTQGFKLVTIIDPGVKVDPHYHIYQAGKTQGLFATTPEGKAYVNRVWPGKAVYPDFGREKTREWWAHNQQFLTDQGVSGVWNDMNEPAGFDGELPDDTEFYDEDTPSTIRHMHNVYGHNMARATYAGLKKLTGKRPFVITRAAYAGTQKYATVWTGDNRSSWAHLQWALPQLGNLAMSGFSFAGTDIGGFLADCTPELLTRWVQAAVFSPLFRNHSCIGSRMQEPWQFDEATLNAYRKMLNLRYQLIDYLYDLFAQGEQDGLPVLRPLVMHYSTDPEVFNLNDELLVGRDLLMAPIVTPGSTHRMVYLPAGQWVNYFTGKCYLGGQHIVVHAGYDELPLFVRSGAVLPLRPVSDHVDVAAETTITFKLFGDAAIGGTYCHYQDNGEDFAYQTGEYNLYHVSFADDGEPVVALSHHGYQPVYQTITLIKADQTQTLLHWDEAREAYK